MKKSTIFSILCIFLLIPATLYLGTTLPGRWFYLTSTLIIIETMIPFFLAFETRKPQARELVTIAVMAAIAAVSRMAFAFIPHFKPITAIIMITGIRCSGGLPYRNHCSLCQQLCLRTRSLDPLANDGLRHRRISGRSGILQTEDDQKFFV